MNYEDLTFKDIQKLLKEDKEKYDQIPVEYHRKVLEEEWVRRNTVHIDDSSIMGYNL